MDNPAVTEGMVLAAWQTWEHTIIRWGVALVLLSVWTWRCNRCTKFRAKGARSMKEEFRVYGLSRATMYVVGFLKIVISGIFIFGHNVPFLIRPAALLLMILMSVAVLCHLKVERHRYSKACPAYLILFFATYLAIRH